MANNNGSTLKAIVQKTIEMIDQSKQQVYTIVEKTRSEYEQMKLDLEHLKRDTEHMIAEVDALELKDKLMRQKLAEMSKNFNRYSEAEVKKFYESASEIRVLYMSKQNEEKSLRERRSQLEVSLRRFAGVLHDAEQIIHQVSIALGFLKGEVLSALDEISGSDRMLMGIRILEAQENERRRIARDIHDGPAQMMANVVMKADLCEHIAKKDVQKGLDELSELKDMVRESLKEVRDIIFDLRPMSLDDLGLSATLGRLVERIQAESRIKINLVIKRSNYEVEPILSVGLYRIAQEILNNIIKHAKADKVYIELDVGRKFARLLVVNDGIGFDVEQTLERVKQEGSSYGLIGMYERVNQLGGTLKIQSSVETGSVFTVLLPINREVLADDTQDTDDKSDFSRRS
jgi:two-component system sensor histidine kinase DegS